jgi:hypothetical protein|tara:strand:- start:45 stop:575 length:531 start_codon:yes stop_codon:yes gene_type:complete
MFDKKIEKWKSPKTFWLADIIESTSGFHCSIRKVKIYGYEKRRSRDGRNLLRIAQKGKVGKLFDSSTKLKVQMVYNCIRPNEIDKDLDFIVNTCIEAKKRDILRKVNDLQKSIDDIPNRKLQLEQRKKHLEDLIKHNKVSKEEYSWSVYGKDCDKKGDPLKVYSEIKSELTTRYQM